MIVETSGEKYKILLDLDRKLQTKDAYIIHTALTALQEQIEQTNDNHVKNTMMIKLTTVFANSTNNIRYQVFEFFRHIHEKVRDILNHKEIIDTLSHNLYSNDYISRVITIKTLTLFYFFLQDRIDIFHKFIFLYKTAVQPLEHDTCLLSIIALLQKSDHLADTFIKQFFHIFEGGINKQDIETFIIALRKVKRMQLSTEIIDEIFVFLLKVIENIVGTAKPEVKHLRVLKELIVIALRCIRNAPLLINKTLTFMVFCLQTTQSKAMKVIILQKLYVHFAKSMKIGLISWDILKIFEEEALGVIEALSNHPTQINSITMKGVIQIIKLLKIIDDIKVKFDHSSKNLENCNITEKYMFLIQIIFLNQMKIDDAELLTSSYQTLFENVDGHLIMTSFRQYSNMLSFDLMTFGFNMPLQCADFFFGFITKVISTPLKEFQQHMNDADFCSTTLQQFDIVLSIINGVREDFFIKSKKHEESIVTILEKYVLQYLKLITGSFKAWSKGGNSQLLQLFNTCLNLLLLLGNKIDTLQKKEIECNSLEILQESFKFMTGNTATISDECQAILIQTLYYILKRASIFDYLKLARWACCTLLPLVQIPYNKAYLRGLLSFLDTLGALKAASIESATGLAPLISLYESMITFDTLGKNSFRDSFLHFAVSHMEGVHTLRDRVEKILKGEATPSPENDALLEKFKEGLRELSADLESYPFVDHYTLNSLKGFINGFLILSSLLEFALSFKQEVQEKKFQEQLKGVLDDLITYKKKSCFKVEGLDPLFRILYQGISEVVSAPMNRHAILHTVFVMLCNVYNCALIIPRTFFKLIDPISIRTTYLDSQNYLEPDNPKKAEKLPIGIGQMIKYFATVDNLERNSKHRVKIEVVANIRLKYYGAFDPVTETQRFSVVNSEVKTFALSGNAISSLHIVNLESLGVNTATLVLNPDRIIRLNWSSASDQRRNEVNSLLMLKIRSI